MKAKIQAALYSATFLVCGISFQNCAPSDDHAEETSASENSTSITTFGKNKCTFTLAGGTGSLWLVERYVVDSADCSSEEATVRANNPRATISSVSKNYVYDPVASADKTKCTYTLQGSGGSSWFSERYVALNTDCNGVELATVQSNNPLAQIVAVKSSYVYDPVSAADKTKCSYSLRGAGGSSWLVERYTASTSNCDTETSIVRSNNPNATIVSVASNYVHDPF